MDTAVPVCIVCFDITNGMANNTHFITNVSYPLSISLVYYRQQLTGKIAFTKNGCGKNNLLVTQELSNTGQLRDQRVGYSKKSLREGDRP